MKLIIGLGNPGILYKDSRHNIGFTVIRSLAKVYKIVLKKERGVLAITGKGRINGNEVFIAMPLTYMNLSGSAVISLFEKYNKEFEDILVVCDDIDLEFGRLKIRPSGSSAGHRGVQSIIDVLASEEFARLRIGIGRPNEKEETTKYVLSLFNKSEKQALKEVIIRAVDCCEIWVTKGVTESMNVFNKRSQDE